MTDDWACKRHTKLKMFSVFGEKIKSLIDKPSKLIFWNQLHPKIVFVCHVMTSKTTWRPNHTIFTSSVSAILKGMTNAVLLGANIGVVRIFSYGWKFFQWERVYWDWMAWPYLNLFWCIASHLTHVGPFDHLGYFLTYISPFKPVLNYVLHLTQVDLFNCIPPILTNCYCTMTNVDNY